jgi:hypothetical protein
MTNIQYLSLSWILMFLVQELLYLVHACSSCPTLFPDAVVTGICLLILRCFFSGCTRLARLNAAHLLRPKGTLGKKQGNHSFKSYKVARCPQAPSFPRAPRRPRASAGALCAGARAARARAAARAARAARARAARAANLRFKVVLYRP